MSLINHFHEQENHIKGEKGTVYLFCHTECPMMLILHLHLGKVITSQK